MTDELKGYLVIAAEPQSVSDPRGLAGQLLKVSAAIARVGEIAVHAEAVVLHAERRERDGCLKTFPDAPENRVAAYVKSTTIEERIALRESETVLHSLHQRFKAIQSALSYLKTERTTYST